MAQSLSLPSTGVLKRHEKLLDTIRCGTESEAIALFSEEGYDVNTKVDYTFDDRKKYIVTPLAWAVRYKRPLLCKYLLQNGADPYNNLVFDYYPLHEACNRGYVDIVKIFIEIKCDIDRVTSDHHSPLHIACMRGNIECARLLLEAGANRELKNDKGQTPLELGIYHGQTDLCQLFSYYSDSKPTIRRRHSLHSPTGDSRPPLKQGASLDATTYSRPQSMFLVDFSHDGNEEKTGIENSTQTTLQVPNGRTGSHSNRKLVSGGLSVDSSIAQPHTCSGALAPSTSQFHVSPAPVNSAVSMSSTCLGRPQLIAQLSQASSCVADSPSPVERDGVWSSTGNKTELTPALNASSFGPSTSEVQSLEPLVTLGTDTQTPKHLSMNDDRTNKPAKKTNHLQATAPHNDKHYLGTALRSHVSQQNKVAPYHSHSNPEFPLTTHMSVSQNDRTKSYGDLYSKNQKQPQPPVNTSSESKISPSRERINDLSSLIYSTFDQTWATTLSSYTTTACPGSNPVSEVMQKIINVIPLLNFKQAHLQTLMELASTFNQSSGHQDSKSMGLSYSSLSTTICSESKPVHESLATHLSSMGYKLTEEPLTVTFGVPHEGHMTLTFRLVGQSPQMKTALLKVVVRIFDLKNKFESSTYHYSLDDVSFPSFGTDPLEPPQLLEVSLLTQLSRNQHPNIMELISSFKANTIEQHELFAQKLNPDNPKKMYTTAPVADFMILQSPKVHLTEYLNTLKRSGNLVSRSSTVTSEKMILSTLAQVLLAVGHLINNQIAHCAISSNNIYVDESDYNTILLSNFSHAIQLNSQKTNLERIRQTQSRLLADLNGSPSRRHCVFSPEVMEAIENSELENAFLHGELKKIFAKNDTYSAAWMVYCWALSKSHSFLNQEQTKPYSYEDIPELIDFSPQCNHLLKRLIAYNHRDRLSPMEGAMACFVLIFGPVASDMRTEDQCYEWLLAETVEFYMRPVLIDSKVRDYTDSFSKLLCMYLTVASSNPKGVWEACSFFNNYC